MHLRSPSGQYDALYLRNYAVLHVRDELARIPGVGDALLFGAGDYAMRLWLDPDKVAARGLTASDVVNAVRELRHESGDDAYRPDLEGRKHA